MQTVSESSTLEANKALLRRYKAGILNDRDIDALGEVASVDYLDHAALPGQAPGLEGLKERVAIIWRTFDPSWTIDEAIAERDIVVLRWHLTGRHRRDFAGIPATGKPCVLRGIDIYRVRDGKMCEHWNVVDLYDLWRASTGDAVPPGGIEPPSSG